MSLKHILFGKSTLPTPPPSQAVNAYGLVFQNRVNPAFGAMNYQEAVKEGYSALTWVYRCIRKRGEAIGSVPWKTFRVGSDGTSTPLPNHPLEKLVNRPNPYQDRKEFFEQFSTYLDLSGNNYIEVVYGNNGTLPLQLFNLRPDWTKPKPNPYTYISGYEFSPAGRGKIQLLPKDVIHFKYLDPLNEYVGMSPITAAARTLESENAILGWNKSLLDNNGMPGGLLKIPAQTLVKEERQELQAEVEVEFTGENRHRPMILWGGMEWQQLGLSQKDMDFLLQRRSNKYEVCAILGVPPQVVGANEDPTYSNYSVARLSFWEDVIILMLDWIKARFNMILAPMFGPDIILDYDVSDVPAFRESFLQKVKAAEILYKMLWPINAINTRLGLGFDPVPWGDTAYLPSSMVPADGVGSTNLPGPGEDAPEGEEEPEPEEEEEPEEGEDDDQEFMQAKQTLLQSAASRSNAVKSALEKLST